MEQHKNYLTRIVLILIIVGVITSAVLIPQTKWFQGWLQGLTGQPITEVDNE